MERALQILQIPPELQQRVCLDQKKTGGVFYGSGGVSCRFQCFNFKVHQYSELNKKHCWKCENARSEEFLSKCLVLTCF